ncbi:MAG: PEP-CTERM sorting domain-containing protein [Thermoguttaceae bacterium]
MLDYELGTPLMSDEVSMPNGPFVLSDQQFSEFNFRPSYGFGPGSYTLIDAQTITGTLGPSTSGTIAGWDSTLAVSGNDLVLTVVPEPSTLALLGVVGLIGCWTRWQRWLPGGSEFWPRRCANCRPGVRRRSVRGRNRFGRSRRVGQAVGWEDGHRA